MARLFKVRAGGARKPGGFTMGFGEVAVYSGLCILESGSGGA